MGEGTQLLGPPAGLEVQPPGLNRCPHGMLTLQLAVEPIELVSASLEGPVSERRRKPLNSGIVEGAALNLEFISLSDSYDCPEASFDLSLKQLSEFPCKSAIKYSKGQGSCWDCDLGWLIAWNHPLCFVRSELALEFRWCIQHQLGETFDHIAPILLM